MCACGGRGYISRRLNARALQSPQLGRKLSGSTANKIPESCRTSSGLQMETAAPKTTSCDMSSHECFPFSVITLQTSIIIVCQCNALKEDTRKPVTHMTLCKWVVEQFSISIHVIPVKVGQKNHPSGKVHTHQNQRPLQEVNHRNLVACRHAMI